MPRPRPRPAPVSIASIAKGTSHAESEKLDEDTFFLTRPTQRPTWIDDDEASATSSATPAPPSDEASPQKKKRKALPEWVSQSDSHDMSMSSPREMVEEAPEAEPQRARSVSVTPPPELDDDMKEFALRAVENVMRRNTDGSLLEEHAELELGAPTSDDTSLDLHPDLARYYKGPNAHQLRERAIAREREIQMQRQKRNEEAEVTEILVASSPPAPAVIHVDDSSEEDEPAPRPMANDRDEEPSIPQHHEGTMSLVLRAAKGDPVPVKVRPTTKVATILAHFVQTVALATNETERAYLSFEGEVRVPLAYAAFVALVYDSG